MEYSQAPLTVIVSRDAVSLLEHPRFDFRSFISRQENLGRSLRRYPDDSIAFTESDAMNDLGKYLIELGVQGSELAVKTHTRSLAPFPRRHYVLYYTQAYQETLGESGFLFGPSELIVAREGEYGVDNLMVTVGFLRRTTQRVRFLFADAVHRWAASVRDRGIFGNGPARLVSSDVVFTAARAKFRIDASGSGQDTLNWLALTILNFGCDVHPVLGVKFDEESSLDNCFGPERGQETRAAIPLYAEKGASGRGAELEGVIEEADVDGTVPDPVFQSDRFRVRVLPKNDWDDFVMAINFVAPPSHDQWMECANLVKSWLTLAQYGTFGGRGIHSYREPVFDAVHGSLHLTADMVDSDPRLALPALIRALEGLDRLSVAIDSIVMGK